MSIRLLPINIFAVATFWLGVTETPSRSPDVGAYTVFPSLSVLVVSVVPPKVAALELLLNVHA